MKTQELVRESMRFIAVVNKTQDIGKLFNAVGHMTAGLVWQGKDKEKFLFHDYTDGSGGLHPTIPHDPFIILKANNSNQIKLLRENAIKHNITFTDFTKSMTVGSSEEQLLETSSKSESELEYMGICLYGPDDLLRPLTKKFSLFNPELGSSTVNIEKQLVEKDILIEKLIKENELRKAELEQLMNEMKELKIENDSSQSTNELVKFSNVIGLDLGVLNPEEETVLSGQDSELTGLTHSDLI